MQRTVRLIFKTNDCYAAFSKLATRKGLELFSEERKDKTSPLAFQEILVNVDSTVKVHYIEDGLAQLSYLQLTGPRAEPYLKLFRGAFSFFSEDELFANWDNARADDDKIDAIVRIGVAAYDQVPEPYMQRIRHALEDGARSVRDAGLVAFSYAPWPAMKPLVQKLRDADPDDGVRNRARLLLEAWAPTAEA